MPLLFYGYECLLDTATPLLLCDKSIIILMLMYVLK